MQSPKSQEDSMPRIPIVIDTDPGVDDFFCIAIGCAFPEVFDLRAITTIGGNNLTEVTTRNALDILSFLGKSVSVAAGATRFLMREFDAPAAQFHGSNGLGDQVIPHTSNKAVDIPAWEMIYKQACECSGELVVVTVGPETNLAMAIQKHPDIVTKIKKVLVMGGSTTFGNRTPYAESNIFNDPFAAQIVFESGIPIDMVGLNVTHMCPLDYRTFDSMKKDAREDVIAFMRGLIVFRDFQPILHDAIAISTLVDPSFVTWKECNICIETQNEEHLGQTVPMEGTGHRVAIDCDRERYLKVFETMVSRFK